MKKLKKICIFAINMEEEVKREYWPNGQLSSETLFLNGKRQRLLRNWYSNGQLWHEVSYKNGFECGARIIFNY